MQVKEIMTRDVETIESTQSLTEASKMMNSLGIGILPVRKGDQVVGIVTDRDIVVRGLAEGKNPAQTLVSDVMSSKLAFCYEDDDVKKAGKVMEDQQVRRLLIFDRNDTVCGIISLGDLVTRSRQEQFCGEVLEVISEPSEPKRW